MPPLRYDRLAQALHWTIAILIVFNYATMLGWDELPRGPEKTAQFARHVSFGLLVIALVGMRIAWRLNSAPPAPAGPTPLWRFAAKTGHLALYLVLVIMPVLGLVAAWMKGRPVSLFGFVSVPSPLALDRDLGEAIESVHKLIAHLTMILAGFHAGFALFHQFWLKDGTLTRMLPGRAAR